MDVLRNYTFLPWTRRGFGAEISTPDDLASGSAGPERAAVLVSFNANGQPISKNVEVLGPGDVVGINPRAIVKTEPRNWVTDFESNYLPYIEFYEEDFPWRFTSATAANALTETRLRPWIFLVVLKEDEFTDQKATGPLPAFELKEGLDPATFLPPPDQSWAWAHVHVSQNIIGNALQTTSDGDVTAVEQTLEQTLRTNADVGSSRLLCARKLEDNTAYHAFVVPAFETGRLAGLGVDIPANTSGQRSSWDSGQRLYPIYYRWFFRTGEKGDFEFLVDLLEPRPVDKRVGVRSMDMQNPAYEVEGMSGPLRVMGLEGALKSTETESSPAQWPPAGTDFNNPPAGSAGRFLNGLEEKVNLQFNLQQPETSNNPHPDPIVSPPLYGRWYAMAEKLEVQQGTGWVNELNRDPRLRTPAGTGTQVMQKEQEKFMQQAWAQLGDLLQTNQKIRQFQLGWMSSFVAYRKNVLPQATDELLTFTQAVQARVLGSPTTIAAQVQQSRLPRAAIDPAFRRIARPRGAIMRKVVPEGTPPPQRVLTQLNEGKLTAAPAPPKPTGQISLDDAAQSIVAPDVPEWLAALLRKASLPVVLAGAGALAVILRLLKGTLGLVLGAIAIAALLPVLKSLIARFRAAEALRVSFQEKSFKPAAVDRIAPRSNFVLTDFQQEMPTVTNDGTRDSVEAANFRVALKDAFNAYDLSPPPLPVPPPLALDSAVAKLKQALNPAVAVPRRAQFVLKIPISIKDSYLRPQETLVTVMAHPVFAEPMYRALRDISAEFLAPNLGLIPNNTISLMQTNQRFIEAYMVGLNDEMGRELLWREFPTDQRGSYFRQFWDVGDVVNRDPAKPAQQLEEELLDITKLHTWDRDSLLGTHASRPLPTGAEADEARLVLVMRGDLLKKYPTAVIYAQQAKWTTDEQGRQVRVLDESNPAQFVKAPIFKAEIDPDVRFLGFDLTKTVVKGNPDPAANNPGWFFVIQERPGEPRFGLDNLDANSPPKPTNWNELAWEHLAQFQSGICVNVTLNVPDDSAITAAPDDQFKWGRNAGDMAYIFYQVPVMVAFHAADMLPK
jgi:pyruvate/2-oxoglutarate dehydrogenase complex dihydrolipoamide acyltransferase (E2) component